MSRKLKDRLRDPTLQLTTRDHATYSSTLFDISIVPSAVIRVIDAVANGDLPQNLGRDKMMMMMTTIETVMIWMGREGREGAADA